MLVAIAGAAVAGPLEDGEAAYQREDYATAYRLLRPLADQGNAEAQDMLGTMYVVGEGVPKDYSEAVKWYRRAADQGNADAQSHLGLMYHNGLGVPQDYVEAMKWCRLAADQGNAEAQDMLGTMYDHSEGVAKNYSEAVKVDHRAADLGQCRRAEPPRPHVRRRRGRARGLRPCTQVAQLVGRAGQQLCNKI